MKKSFPIFFFGVLILFLGSCAKSDFEFQNDFERSFEVWQNFKQNNQNSYRYTVSGSSWVGSSWETTLTIENGIVTQRDFRYNNFYQIGMPASGWTIEQAHEIIQSLSHPNMPYHLTAEEILAMLSWTEDKDQIGKQTQTAAAKPMTLDEVYDLAKNEWLMKRPDANASFEAKNQGMISSAGYVPHNCADDCFRGIYIISITPL